MARTSVYEPLCEYLKYSKLGPVTLSFDMVERIIQRKLPKSAYIYSAWWGNHLSHSQAKYGWLNGGWKQDDVNLPDQRVTFIRTR